jgi:hypothetical protein
MKKILTQRRGMENYRKYTVWFNLLFIPSSHTSDKEHVNFNQSQLRNHKTQN